MWEGERERERAVQIMPQPLHRNDVKSMKDQVLELIG